MHLFSDWVGGQSNASEQGVGPGAGPGRMLSQADLSISGGQCFVKADNEYDECDALCQDDDLFALQLVHNLVRDEIEVQVILDEIQIVGGDGQNRAVGKAGCPFFVQLVELSQIV